MVEVVARIIRLTQKGKLVWKERNPQDLPILNRDSHEYVSIVFESVYHETKLRLYERHYKTYVPAKRTVLPRTPEKKEALLSGEVILEIVGLDEMAVWSFPDVNPLKDLLSTVQYQVGGVKKFLDYILEDRVLA
jgi:hypothetical protein